LLFPLVTSVHSPVASSVHSSILCAFPRGRKGREGEDENEQRKGESRKSKRREVSIEGRTKVSIEAGQVASMLFILLQCYQSLMRDKSHNVLS
jgi:hypothetical protein